MTDNFIRPLDFCEIVSDKFTEETGVKRGNIVFVAGLKALPVSDEDPYTQRIKMFCHLVNDGHVNTSQLYVIDPSSIQKVGKSRQKKLSNILSKDFLGRENNNEIKEEVNVTESSD